MKREKESAVAPSSHPAAPSMPERAHDLSPEHDVLPVSATPNEEIRLARLKAYGILDTEEDPTLDRLTSMAAIICDTPIALISLVDHQRQWFKSCYGISQKETSRSVSLCSHAILEPDRPLIVNDLSEDPRFRDKPLVFGQEQIRFYAGIPLVDSQNTPLGTLCVMDRKPRELNGFQLSMLDRLAAVAIDLIQGHKMNKQLSRLLRLEKEVYNRLLRSSSDLASTKLNFDEALNYMLLHLDANLGWLTARIRNMQTGGITGIHNNPSLATDPNLARIWHIVDTKASHPADLKTRTSYLRPGEGLPEYSYMAVPVLMRQRLVALIELIYPDHRKVDERIAEVFELMASNLSIIAERELVAVELRYRATHDPLTGAENRDLIHQSIQRAISECDPLKPSSAVLFFDLDGFKDVNDNFGHETGDRLLQEVVNRLKSICRDNDMLGRLSGDEFVLLARDIDIEEGVAPLLSRIRQTLSASFRLGELEIRVDSSIGVSIITSRNVTPNELIRRSEEAMYLVKTGQRKGFCIADAEVVREFEMRRSMDRKVKEAFHNNRLLLDFQPIIDLSTGKVSGSEALARLLLKDGGIMPAFDFIKAVERTRLLSDLDEWALAEMLRLTANPFCQTMLTQHGCRISVNIGPPILSTKGYAERCLRQLRNTGFPPESLTLEIIESNMLQPSRFVIENLQALRAGGVKIALDDFGTGYSNLLQVSKLPVDIIKIDKEFISGITPENSKANELLSAMVGIGKNLGFLVVAEGVETELQANFVKLIGCTHAQGYLYGKPMSLEAMKKLMMEEQGTTEPTHS